MNKAICGVWLSPEETLPKPMVDVLVAVLDDEGEESVLFAVHTQDGRWLLSHTDVPVECSPFAWMPCPDFPTAMRLAA